MKHKLKLVMLIVSSLSFALVGIAWVHYATHEYGEVPANATAIKLFFAVGGIICTSMFSIELYNSTKNKI